MDPEHRRGWQAEPTDHRGGLALLELFGLKFWRSGAVCQWVGHSERAAGDSEQVQMDVSFTKHFDQLIDQLKSVARSVAF